MTAAGWFLLGATTTAPVFGLALWLLLVPGVRRRAYAVCQEQARLQYGPRPACAEGFNMPESKHRHRSPDRQHVPGPPPRVLDDMPRH